MWFVRSFMFLLFCVSMNSIAANHTVYFKPKSVNLIGTILTLTFPGPPNYSNIEEGDKKEIGSYLVLDKPVDVKVAPGIRSNINHPENNIKIIQLSVGNDTDWKKLRDGNRVQISGDLFHAIWGHHHTLVLLHTKKITVISQKRIVNNNISVYLTDNDMEEMKNLQGIVELKTQSNGLNISIKKLPR